MGARRRCLTLLLGGCLAFAGIACGGPEPSVVPVSAPLPVEPAWRGGCGIGVGRDLILHGALGDPRVTWGTERTGGGRAELQWPVGYQAWFIPQLVLLDENGIVVGHEGDLIIGDTMCLDRQVGDPLLVDEYQVKPPNWQGDG